MRISIIAALLLFPFVRCGSVAVNDRGHHAKDAIDTTYYIGQYGFHVNLVPSGAIAFPDTMLLIHFKDDSVVFRIREVYYFSFLDSTREIGYLGAIFKYSPKGRYEYKIEEPDDTFCVLCNVFAGGDSCNYINSFVTDSGNAIREGYFSGKKMVLQTH